MDDTTPAGIIESPPPKQPSATMIAALVKAQSQFGRVIKDRENPAFRSAYATLSACLDAVVPALNENGFFLTQFLSNTPDGITVETIVHHDSGESLVLGVFSLSPTKFDPQGVGSATTYAKRYGLKAAFGLSDAEDDDDGNAASAHVPRNQPEQAPRNAATTRAASKPATAAPKPAPPAQANAAAKTAAKPAAPPAQQAPAANTGEASKGVMAKLALQIIQKHEADYSTKTPLADVIVYGNALGLMMTGNAEAVRLHIESKGGVLAKAPAPRIRALVDRWRAVYPHFQTLWGLAKQQCGVGHTEQAHALLRDLQEREGWTWTTVALEVVEQRAAEIEKTGVWVKSDVALAETPTAGSAK